MTWSISVLVLAACGDPRIPDDAIWAHDATRLLGADASGALVAAGGRTTALDTSGDVRWEADTDRITASPTGIYRYAMHATGVDLVELAAADGAELDKTHWQFDVPFDAGRPDVVRGAHQLGLAWHPRGSVPIDGFAAIGDPATTAPGFFDMPVAFGRDEHVVILDRHATEATLDGTLGSSTATDGLFVTALAVANDGAAIVAYDPSTISRLHDGEVAWTTKVGGGHLEDGVLELAVNDRDQIIALTDTEVIWLAGDGAELARVPYDGDASTAHMALGAQLYITTTTGTVVALEGAR